MVRDYILLAVDLQKSPPKNQHSEGFKVDTRKLTLEAYKMGKRPHDFPALYRWREMNKRQKLILWELAKEPRVEHIAVESPPVSDQKFMKEVGNELDNLIFDILEKDRSNISYDIEMELQDFYKKILIPLEEYISIFVIGGRLALDCKLPYTEKIRIDTLKSVSNQYNLEHPFIKNENDGKKPCIILSLWANSHKSAKFKGERIYRDYLEMIRCFTGYSSSSIGCDWNPARQCITVRKNDNNSYFTAELDHYFGLRIPSNFCNQLSSYLATAIPHIIERKSKLSNRISRAFRWVGDAIADPDPDIKIVKIFTGLESIFVPESPGFKGPILTSRIFLLQVKANPDSTFSDPWFWKIGYDLRSKIVHGAHDFLDFKLEIDDKWIKKLERHTFNIMKLVCDIIEQENFTKITPFIRWIEDPDYITEEMISTLLDYTNRDENIKKYLDEIQS